jgi:hypothetical protein
LVAGAAGRDSGLAHPTAPKRQEAQSVRNFIRIIDFRPMIDANLRVGQDLRLKS